MRAQTVLNGEYDILFQIAQVTPASELEASVHCNCPSRSTHLISTLAFC